MVGLSAPVVTGSVVVGDIVVVFWTSVEEGNGVAVVSAVVVVDCFVDWSPVLFGDCVVFNPLVEVVDPDVSTVGFSLGGQRSSICSWRTFLMILRLWLMVW